MSGDFEPGDYHPNGCEVSVFQQVGVMADVTLTPEVHCGPLSVTCGPGRIIPADEWPNCHEHNRSCRLILLQDLCVEVPVRVHVDAACRVIHVECGPASTDPDGCRQGESSGESSSSGSSESESDCSDSSGSDSSGSSGSESCP